jgi:hypothetical protein
MSSNIPEWGRWLRCGTRRPGVETERGVGVGVECAGRAVFK